ncbi:MAG: hypothetical protein NTY77_03650 [Elusimicrobia bacterium]|nr:hypothetical protein [Elusimicrobiota bacterium]
MSDIQLAVLLAALAGLAYYVRIGLERESGPSGLLDAQPHPTPTDRAATGVSSLLWGHLFCLLACIPLLAYSPYSLDEGHSMGRWLSDFLRAWLLWAGLLQLIYLVPLWRSLRAQSRPAAARGLLLAGGATVSASGLSWAFALNMGRAPAAVQAGSGLLALASVVALIWCGRELRRSLRG